LPYSAKFKDHLAHPRNAGELSDANAVADETNPICGDRLRLSLIVKDGRIEAVRYLAYGCPPTLVCGSVLTELLGGASLRAELGAEGAAFVRARYSWDVIVAQLAQTLDAAILEAAPPGLGEGLRLSRADLA